MSKLNFDPITTFPNGSQLVVSTNHTGQDSFTCELFEANPSTPGGWELRMISNHLEGATCLAAQTSAYDYAKRVYPQSSVSMKEPPYLIWVGPGVTTSLCL
jgi:hypothetical protein